MKIQLKRSNVLDGGSAKEPTAAQMEYGELAVNYNTDDPVIFIKDSNDQIIRLASTSPDVLVQDTAPPTADYLEGQLWWNSDSTSGKLFVLYNDPSGGGGTDAGGLKWIETSPTPEIPSIFPDLNDDENQSGTTDDRYLRIDPLPAGANNQVVQSTGTTTFDGEIEASGGVTINGSSPNMGASIFGVEDENYLAFTTENTKRLEIKTDGVVITAPNRANSRSLTGSATPTVSDADLTLFTAFANNGSVKIDRYIGYSSNVNNALETNETIGFEAVAQLGSAKAAKSYGFHSYLLPILAGTTPASENYNFYAAGTAPNFFAGDTYIGGTTARNTRELWESLLTEEQKEELAAGTLVVPANVATPGDGEFARQWWYDRQSAEDQALIDAGELDYPERFAAATFTDTFTLGDNSSIDLIASTGTAAVKSLGFYKGFGSISHVKYNGFFNSGFYQAPLLVSSCKSNTDTAVTGLIITNYAYDPTTNKNINLTKSISFKFQQPANAEGDNTNSTVDEHTSIVIENTQDPIVAANGTVYGVRSRQTDLSASGKNAFNFYAEGTAPNFFKGDTYIGGSTSTTTRELWESLLTEEQKEELAAGTLAIPANVSTPGDGEFARQWWYDQQDEETQALIDAGELEYPEHFQAANFVDTFALSDTTNIQFIANLGAITADGSIQVGPTTTSGPSPAGAIKSDNSGKTTYYANANQIDYLQKALVATDTSSVKTPVYELKPDGTVIIGNESSANGADIVLNRSGVGEFSGGGIFGSNISDSNTNTGVNLAKEGIVTARRADGTNVWVGYKTGQDAGTSFVKSNGKMGLGGEPFANTVFQVTGSFAGDGGDGISIRTDAVLTSGNNNGAICGHDSRVSTTDTGSDIFHFRALGTQTATINGQSGFLADNTLISELTDQATPVRGFDSRLVATNERPNTYNFYAEGTAPNYFQGTVILTDGIDTFKNKLGSGGCSLFGRSAASDENSGAIQLIGVNDSAARVLMTFTGSAALDGASPVRTGYIENLAGSAGIRIVSKDGTISTLLSDPRNISNVQPLSLNASNIIKQLEPKSFEMGGASQYGFVSSELKQHLPIAVEGNETETRAIGTLADYDGTVLETEVTEPTELEYTEDVDTDGVTTQVVRTRTWTPTGTRPVYQGVDQTKLIPLLTKALQEALDKIEVLEQRLSDAGIA